MPNKDRKKVESRSQYRSLPSPTPSKLFFLETLCKDSNTGDHPPHVLPLVFIQWWQSTASEPAPGITVNRRLRQQKATSVLSAEECAVNEDKKDCKKFQKG